MRELATLGFVFALVAISQPAAAETAQSILQQTDKVRNPGAPFTVLDTLVEYKSGKPTAKTVLRVYAKLDQEIGQYKNLVRYVEPADDAGKSLLMSGNIMWFYDPNSAATIRISPQQRLLGQASNGDVLSVNLSGDYIAALSGEEAVESAEHKSLDCWRLDLSAAKPSAVYGRIEYWVEKGTYHPVKARFYADSGRLLKVAFYAGYQSALGGERPTEVFIVDELDKSLVTTMSFTGYASVDIPDAWYQRSFLPHLPNE
ncbi:MAG: outer membrane lipoprotein-sorting protein [Parvularculaceae bacterium]